MPEMTAMALKPQPSTLKTINQRDVRDTPLWDQLDKHFHSLHSPAFGKVSDASDPHLSPDGRTVVFTGTIWNKLEDGLPQRRICLADTDGGDKEPNVITYGPNNDQLPKWSPSGKTLALLSDRKVKGTFHLYLLRVGQWGEAKPVYLPPGYTAEYASWSPVSKEGDEGHILIGAAGLGADQSSTGGSGTVGSGEGDKIPSWMPFVDPDTEKNPSRRVFVYSVADDKLRPLSPEPSSNVWDAAWCGTDKVAAIASQDETESSWYFPHVELIDLDTGKSQKIAAPSKELGPVQLGGVSASPSGSHVAYIEGLASDRGLVAGTPMVVDVESRKKTRLKAGAGDVTQVSWINDQELFFTALRGLNTVTGRINVADNKSSDIWETSDSLGIKGSTVSQVVDSNFAVVRSSWTLYPEIGLVNNSSYQTLLSLDHDGASYLRSVCGPVEEVSWPSFDGLQIQGFLCLPKNAPHKKPFPLILHVHGGPIWAFTNAWSLVYPSVPVLVSRGYAVLSCNPRGSRGRGEDFARKVQGDMGGNEIKDLLTGVDALVESGTVDPKRIGVTGGSHGGFISTWLITQTDRFAASVAVAPVTNWVSQHGTSNIGSFDRLMLKGEPHDIPRAGHYEERSPVRFAKQCSTPLLQLVGAEDHSTPPTQGLEMHAALRERGVDSALVTYPGEGHGVHKFPGVVDVCWRTVAWFERYMPAGDCA